MLVPLEKRQRLLTMCRRPGTYKVPDSTSDGYAQAATWNAGVAANGTLTAANLALGRDDATHWSRAGIRFFPVAVPQGAHVAWAKVRLNSDFTWSAGGQVKIRAEPVDNAGVFAVWPDVWTRARGAEEVLWVMGAQTVNKWYETPDIGAVIQAVVGRAGWVSGNGLVVFIDCTSGTNDWKHVHSWDEGMPQGKVCPELLIQL